MRAIAALYIALMLPMQVLATSISGDTIDSLTTETDNGTFQLGNIHSTLHSSVKGEEDEATTSEDSSVSSSSRRSSGGNSRKAVARASAPVATEVAAENENVATTGPVDSEEIEESRIAIRESPDEEIVETGSSSTHTEVFTEEISIVEVEASEPLHSSAEVEVPTEATPTAPENIPAIVSQVKTIEEVERATSETTEVSIEPEEHVVDIRDYMQMSIIAAPSTTDELKPAAHTEPIDWLAYFFRTIEILTAIASIGITMLFIRTLIIKHYD